MDRRSMAVISLGQLQLLPWGPSAPFPSRDREGAVPFKAV